MPRSAFAFRASLCFLFLVEFRTRSLVEEWLASRMGKKSQKHRRRERIPSLVKSPWRFEWRFSWCLLLRSTQYLTTFSDSSVQSVSPQRSSNHPRALSDKSQFTPPPPGLKISKGRSARDTASTGLIVSSCTPICGLMSEWWNFLKDEGGSLEESPPSIRADSTNDAIE